MELVLEFRKSHKNNEQIQDVENKKDKIRSFLIIEITYSLIPSNASELQVIVRGRKIFSEIIISV